jgi:hypothetical protein
MSIKNIDMRGLPVMALVMLSSASFGQSNLPNERNQTHDTQVKAAIKLLKDGTAESHENNIPVFLGGSNQIKLTTQFSNSDSSGIREAMTIKGPLAKQLFDKGIRLIGLYSKIGNDSANIWSTEGEGFILSTIKKQNGGRDIEVSQFDNYMLAFTFSTEGSKVDHFNWGPSKVESTGDLSSSVSGMGDILKNFVREIEITNQANQGNENETEFIDNKKSFIDFYQTYNYSKLSEDSEEAKFIENNFNKIEDSITDEVEKLFEVDQFFSSLQIENTLLKDAQTLDILKKDLEKFATLLKPVANGESVGEVAWTMKIQYLKQQGIDINLESVGNPIAELLEKFSDSKNRIIENFELISKGEVIIQQRKDKLIELITSGNSTLSSIDDFTNDDINLLRGEDKDFESLFNKYKKTESDSINNIKDGNKSTNNANQSVSTLEETQSKSGFNWGIPIGIAAVFGVFFAARKKLNEIYNNLTSKKESTEPEITDSETVSDTSSQLTTEAGEDFVPAFLRPSILGSKSEDDLSSPNPEEIKSDDGDGIEVIVVDNKGPKIKATEPDIEIKEEPQTSSFHPNESAARNRRQQREQLEPEHDTSIGFDF